MKTQTSKTRRTTRRIPRPEPLTARQLMTPDPVTVTPETHLMTAASKMSELGLRHLPVVDAAGKLVGMISDRDLRVALGNPGEALRTSRLDEVEELTVESMMAGDPISIELDTPVKTIAEILAVEHIGAVPVIDEGDHVTGIVSYVDVLAYYAAREA